MVKTLSRELDVVEERALAAVDGLKTEISQLRSAREAAEIQQSRIRDGLASERGTQQQFQIAMQVCKGDLGLGMGESQRTVW